MQIEAFDPVNTPLHKGVSLIEASAGTGKTYTITMLVLRLVVELDISIDQILVVTFTKAATEELKARIRNRLAEAKRILADACNITDQTVFAWLKQLDFPSEVILKRINLALLDIDQAVIFTIHGFCQRVLAEHALASGQLFDAELNEDIASVVQACSDDFWRRNVLNRTPWEVAVITHHIATPDQLLESVKLVADDALILPDNGNLDDIFNELRQFTLPAKNYINDYAPKILPCFDEKKFKTDYQTKFLAYVDLLSEWLYGNTDLFPGVEALSLLTYQGLLDGLNGNQFRKKNSQEPEERKAEFLAALALNTQPFDDLAAKAAEIPVILRRNLLETLRVEIDKQLEQMNAWSFDNLITHLAKALKNDQDSTLIPELRQRFQVALIDEFQDTDNNQWHIFSSIFAADSHRLLMVGDPKQAIYKFRGADIFSYLTAQNQAQHRYTLTSNWRSHPKLVSAVNLLFQKENAFLLPDISFLASQAALTEQDGALSQNGAICKPMMLWQLRESDTENGYWTSGKAEKIIQTAVVNEIAELLNEDYLIQPTNRNVLPQDIAILVRSNRQARDYQEALRVASIPSVLNSTESVFASKEASHLFTLLEAIAHPGDINLLGQALALNWFGYDGQTLYRLLNNETEIDAILARFLRFHQLWQQKGVMAMMDSLMQQEAIVKAIAKSEQAERCLTNLQHSLELLQQAVIDQRLGLHKTLSWLKSAITDANGKTGSAENQQLRLESDENAVTIITMHRAKGLEYPIVFCPYLWQDKQNNDKNNPLVQCHLPDENNKQDTRLIVDLGSSQLDRHLSQAQFEDKAETIRLAYVALTRAKYRCYLAWADVRTKDKANESALAWLLSLANKNFVEQQATLKQLVTENSDTFGYRLLDSTEDILYSYQQPNSHSQLSAEKRRRSVYTNWQMSSYTALSALGLTDTSELPADKADETYYQFDATADALPAGAQTGNVVHELLENIPFVELAKRSDITAVRDKACQRYGLKLEHPEIINDLLYRSVNTPLSADDLSFCLINIPEKHCLKEMPFYLSMPEFNTHKLNEILNKEPTFQPLSHKQMSGFLTGFIDLICEYEGRYYVMDYKTNSLADYENQTLIQAMREHNYGLQYWIYCVVLHRYLTHRLKGYRYSDHFGGVRYLFVRGMKPEFAMSGVFAAIPDLITLEALSALFGK